MMDCADPFRDHIADWPEPAQNAFSNVRALFLQSALAANVGPLEESLKWGQPAWRPRRPRTGTTARLGWQPDAPDLLSIYVDCKTDLATRMHDLYPELPVNDGRRHLAISLTAPLPEPAISHLAVLTFTYHRAKKT